MQTSSFPAGRDANGYLTFRTDSGQTVECSAADFAVASEHITLGTARTKEVWFMLDDSAAVPFTGV